MATRPEGIVYGPDDQPPPLVTLILAIQLVGFLGVLMVLPVVLARAADVDQQTTVAMVSATMLTAGLGVLLQVIRSKWFGSGLLAPTGTTGAALPAVTAFPDGANPDVPTWGQRVREMGTVLDRLARPDTERATRSP